MQDRRLLGFFLFAFAMAVTMGVSGNSGFNAQSSSSDTFTDTTWSLMVLAGQGITPGPTVTLRFDADGTLSGFDGCNRYWGSFSVDGTALQIDEKLASTRAACRETLMQRASNYIQALINATSFTLDANRLSLLDLNSNEIAKFKVIRQTLSRTSWEVIAYNNGKQAVVSVLGGTRVTVNFGDDGRLTGNAGCNQYFAEYRGTEGVIHIGMPGATRRFCAEPDGLMEQETRYLEALQSAATFRLEGERLALRTAGGALAVTLVRDSAAELTHPAPVESKIHFDLDRLNTDGLQGPPGGLRALHYEYCIPDQTDTISEVTAADPTLQIQRGSPGRVGCSQDQLLCLGHTHQSNYRYVLERLAELPFVGEIREAFFE